MKRFKLIYTPFPDMFFNKNVTGFAAEMGGQYLIMIDNRQNADVQARALRHELAHLVLDHLSVTKPLYQINSFGDDMFGEGWEDREHEADRYADEMTDTELSDLMQYAI